MGKLPDLRKALDTVNLLIEKAGDEVGRRASGQCNA